ncbi:hypothetical protein, partial [Acidithiobacillus thiooxidans]|uniref:hypothetical protein n=1 Tax=Acidithiobacillus thiooxidans TaxID=930 RepID=UPI001C07CF76
RRQPPAIGPLQYPEVARKIRRSVTGYGGKALTPVFSGPIKTTPSIKYLDISKAYYSLGWIPMIPLDDGLAMTISWYKRHWQNL